ncbi:MAG: hypothetical protein WCK92_07975 [Bacteroidota bacterium]
MTLLIPKPLEHLIDVKKIKYKNEYIKTVHLFHLVHRFIYEWTFDRKDVPLYSKTLQNIYGMKYHLLLEYLMENSIIKQTGNYSTETGAANKYKLLVPLDVDVLIYQSKDYVFNKNYLTYLEEKKKSILDVKSPIPIPVRKKLLSDLKSVTITNYNEAIRFINEAIKNNRRKYLKNLIMITKLRDGDIFWDFDKHGRFHSNLTSLMKDIRENYLLIDGEPIRSLDIKTSQPFFLVQIMKREWLVNSDPEIQQFIKLVETGDLYNHFIQRYPDMFTDRKSVKPMVFKCLFDEEKYNHVYKELFRSEFPVVYEFIENYHGNYGEPLWKTLQRMESQLIFGTIYPIIISEIKGIKMFSVHDSIHYPEKYHGRVKKIWDAALEEVINKG